MENKTMLEVIETPNTDTESVLKVIHISHQPKMLKLLQTLSADREAMLKVVRIGDDPVDHYPGVRACTN